MGKLCVNFLSCACSKLCYHRTDVVCVKCCDQVSGVAFDSYWSSPNSNDNGETIMYRFGSVGQVLRKMFHYNIYFFYV